MRQSAKWTIVQRKCGQEVLWQQQLNKCNFKVAFANKQTNKQKQDKKSFPRTGYLTVVCQQLGSDDLGNEIGAFKIKLIVLQ